jgi:uncharacterized protein YqgV (UPF0045/DUF77 family)
VDKAIKVVIDSGLKYEVRANSTTVEGPLNEVLSVVMKAHAVARDEGSGRVFTITPRFLLTMLSFIVRL